MDALGHFGFINEPGEIPTYFGGLTQSEVVGPTGLNRLGIDKAEPIITSVVMLDAAMHLNNGKALAPGCTITHGDIEHILAAQGLAHRGINAGDVVFIHTGHGAEWSSNPSTYYTQAPGLSHDATVFLASKKILTQAGVHQIQNLNLTELAQRKMYLGAVFILPIRFKGGAGSPVRPVVIGHPND
jgi:kynurenine formamidase